MNYYYLLYNSGAENERTVARYYMTGDIWFLDNTMAFFYFWYAV